jgi:hypothetical protein
LVSLGGSIALPSLAGIDTIRKVDVLERKIDESRDLHGYYEWTSEKRE